jgi:hypothetical protein
VVPSIEQSYYLLVYSAEQMVTMKKVKHPPSAFEKDFDANDRGPLVTARRAAGQAPRPKGSATARAAVLDIEDLDGSQKAMPNALEDDDLPDERTLAVSKKASKGNKKVSLLLSLCTADFDLVEDGPGGHFGVGLPLS